MHLISKHFSVSTLAAASLACTTLIAPANEREERGERSEHGETFRHVLLFSVDGLHASDVADYVKAHPTSALARLSAHGLTYAQASCPTPSDSFVGLLGMLTGGSPSSTGVYYDDTYDRHLLPPLVDPDGNPLGGSTPGTEILFDETIDNDPSRLDAGGGINPMRLPRDPNRADGHGGFAPVYPHDFLRVNTVFEVAKKAHLHTAWADKHPSYDIVNGPSGKGVDDLFTPEITSFTPESASSTKVAVTKSLVGTEHYDDTKVAAILNQINGWDSGHTKRTGTPAIFGMNFQAVSVGQRLISNVNPDGTGPADHTRVKGGYLIEGGTGALVPSPLLADALNYTDGSLGKIMAALHGNGLDRSTLVILSAKHGSSPIDPTKLKSGVTGFPLGSAIGNLIAPVASAAQVTADDVALIWLKNQAETPATVAALRAGQASAFIDTIYSGSSLALLFGNPANDVRIPDVVVQPQAGVIYSNSTAKGAEHGGFTQDDTHVALIVSNPQIEAAIVRTPVQTTQVAPSILSVLGLNPEALDAVRSEGTQVLPGFHRD